MRIESNFSNHTFMAFDTSIYTEYPPIDNRRQVFRFFSEIPFSCIDDSCLKVEGTQRNDLQLRWYQAPTVFRPTFTYQRSRQLEIEEGALPKSGTWGISLLRSTRFWGDSPISVPDDWEGDSVEWNTLNKNEIADAQKGRTLCYHRVNVNRPPKGIQHKKNIDELLYAHYDGRTNRLPPEYSLSIKLTYDWYQPPVNGILSIDKNSDVLGSHCVAAIGYTDEGLVIYNSWGSDWGYKGHCIIPLQTVKNFIIEAWIQVERGLFPLLQSRQGQVCLSWKLASSEIFGEEIVDAGSGERLAWAFATISNVGNLNIEEFFVLPQYRKRGYASILAERLKLLSKITGRKLSMLVPWADCESHKIVGITKVADLLNLKLNTSENPEMGLIGEIPVKPFQIQSIANLESITDSLYIPCRPEGPQGELLPRIVPVWFATNRNLDSDQKFGTEWCDTVRYGKCNVTIPRWHKFGKVPESQWNKFLNLFGIGDQSKYTVNYPLEWMDVINFYDSIKFSLQSEHLLTDNALVFLHGYNVDFEEAAICAAQLCFDLKIPNTAFFSWASKGSIFGYSSDEETIRLSEDALSDFLFNFTECFGAEKVHIIAHSMGNRGLLQAYERIFKNVEKKRAKKVKLGQVFLAAPDVNTHIFQKSIQTIIACAKRVTLYTSKRDWALWFSHGIHSYPRAGSAPPFTIVDGVDTIHFPKINWRDNWGHSYFSKMEELLYDVHSLIVKDQSPRQRQRLTEKTTDNDQIYYEFTS
ncbi:hypothetical protein FACS1894170_02200 [Planctomycetales bacterium]|nr:hypothetical protein FACS1894170_02200 [Planctomycetales bacterium]